MGKLRRTLSPSSSLSTGPIPSVLFTPDRGSESKRHHNPFLEPEETMAGYLKRYLRDPLAFVRYELGIPTNRWPQDYPPEGFSGVPPLWSKQREVLKSLIKYRKVAVKSGHSNGKTYIAALAVLYLTYVWRALGVTTAPGFRQVRRLLWGEIHNAYHNAPKQLGGQLNQTSLDLGPKWYVEGFATDSAETNFQGFHEENIFAVVDEAGGVDNSIFDQLDTILTSKSSFVLLIGNPTDATSRFADYFKPGSDYHNITISCWDSPNVKHQQLIYPKLVAPDWPQKMLEKWGEDDPWYRSRVLGEFPEINHNVLIPAYYLEMAMGKTLPADYPFNIGCDVARRGNDRTVIGVRYRSGKFRILEVVTKYRGTEVAKSLLRWYQKFEKFAHENDHTLFVNVDGVGEGNVVADILIDEYDIPTNAIIPQGAPDDDEEDYQQFLNKRAQAYWNLKTAFQEGEVDIDDDELVLELSKVERGLETGRDKIRIIDKELIKKKLRGRSPDKADTMMLCWARDYVDFDGDLVHFL